MDTRIKNRTANTRVTRAERILNKLVDNEKLSLNGKAAFLAAVDPFHDMEIDHLRGWPDLESQASVVRHVKQSITVKSTADGGSIVIQTNPIMNWRSLKEATRVGNSIATINPLSSDVFIAPVHIEYYGQSVDFALSDVTAQSDINPDRDFLSAKTRLIGMGVEVYDVTADIYKQGTITTIEMPQSDRVGNCFSLNPQVILAPPGLTKAGSIIGRPISRHPDTLEQAMYFAGARQWDAKQGVYTVVPFSTAENPPRLPEFLVPYLYEAGSEDKCDYLSGLPFWMQAYDTSATPEDYPPTFIPNRWAPIHSKVIYLTGLNEQSTFTVNTSMFFETFPDVSEYAILTLARPSAHYDPVALEMISACMQHLPIAVPVKDNTIGDWILDAVQLIAPFLGETFGAFVGGPAGALAGGALGAAASTTLRNWAQQPAKQQDQFNTPPAFRGPPPPLPPRSYQNWKKEKKKMNKGRAKAASKSKRDVVLVPKNGK
jgi:hypothetical protein